MEHLKKMILKQGNSPSDQLFCYFYISGVHRRLSTRFEARSTIWTVLIDPTAEALRDPVSTSSSSSLLTPLFKIDEANPTSIEKPRPARLHETNPRRRPSLPSPRICRGSRGRRHDPSAAAFRVIPESPLKPSIMSSASAAVRSQSPALKALFKTPEGRYNLLHEKTLPSAAASHGKFLTIAYLKEKPLANPSQAAPSATSSGVRSAAARLLGAGNGSRSLSNGVSRVVSANSKTGGPIGASVGSIAQLPSPNYDGKGTYLIFNAADSLFIIQSYLLLIIKKFHCFYSRCTCVAWVTEREGTFVVGHADGNIYVYEKSKDVTADSSFPVIKDQTQFSVAHTRSNKVIWKPCIICIVIRILVGYLRVFDFSKEQLAFGGKSYYGALLCSAWRLVELLSIHIGRPQIPKEQKKMSCIVLALLVSVIPPSKLQDAQLLLWDLVMDELLMMPPPQTPRRLPGGLPTLSSVRSHSATTPLLLLPAPSIGDIPKISPLVAQCVHTDPLSALVFTDESVIAISREAHLKIWERPQNHQPTQSGGSSPKDNAATIIIH
ncbi:hypothetical protein B296_00029120 [Ensete ventricosum]|uniref:Uncharacterized protein n=1 Tax=Ensete ventricosum TaxID=4639 RepID=A0A426YJW3_ENSVE|nr:hypothetical protein B296_00029120 [Ensete ventricosum]